MSVPRFGSALAGFLAAALVVLITSPLSAQGGAIVSGTVTSEDGNPLGGASVMVTNTNINTVTAQDGTYRLEVPQSAVRADGQIVLTARFIGHRPNIQRVAAGPSALTVNFQLPSDPLRLDEVIVTGTAEATEARKLSFAVAKVTDEQLQEVPGTSALVAIQGKVAGARLIPASAQPGADMSIRLRGATSIGGRQDPLYIVDGVITRFGLADIAAEDVERVEIIKGAAASSLYGSDAANGVVQIFTKRGRALPEGDLRVTVRTETGVNNMPKRMEFSRSHFWQIDAGGDYVLSATGARQSETDQIADNPFKVYYDPWSALVKSGLFTTQYVSIGQRRGTTNFNASFQNTRNEGVIYGLGGYKRQNFRMNLDQQLRPDLDASFSAFYGTSTNGRSAEGQDGPFYGLMFVQPDVDITTPDPVWGYKCTVPLSGDVANDFNPLCELENRKITEDRNRFTGSTRLRWSMTDWLTAEGTMAYDQEADRYKDVTPHGFPTSSGTATEGSLQKRSRNNYELNATGTLSARWTMGSISNTTKVAAVLENQENTELDAVANAFIVDKVPEFDGTDPSGLETDSREETIRNQNFFAITTFDIKDRYIADALIRRDGSSLFGPESRWATYFRVSGAWRVTEDVALPSIDELRLRASYGTAGLRPTFDDQYEILAVTPGGFTKEILGNPLLKPAKSSELEVGGNLEFGRSRFSLEYTYAKKRTRDQILLVDLPSVAGFQQQWQNVGTLESKTHEATFAARLIDRGGTSFSLNIVGDRTRQVITEWPLPERLYGFEQMPSAFFQGKGSNLGVLYGNKWVRDIEELYDDPGKNPTTGTYARDNMMINEDGYVVLKSAYGTINERAIKYVTCKREDATGCLETTNIVEIGDANPDFNMSFGATLSFNRLVINGLLDVSRGADIYNGTRQWAFQATRDRVQDQGSKPANAATCVNAGDCPRKPAGYYAVGFYNGLDPSDYFIENGSYAKLKELSLNYTLVQDQLRRVGLGSVHELRLGLIARNLFTITDYSGLDPEISGLYGDPFQVRMDWFQYPQFRTYTAVFEISF